LESPDNESSTSVLGSLVLVVAVLLFARGRAVCFVINLVEIIAIFFRLFDSNFIEMLGFILFEFESFIKGLTF